MEKQGILTRLAPYIVAFLSFAAVSCAYFAPQFSGKTLETHDVKQYNGMSQEIHDHRDKYGEDPQWTGGMFGGMPGQLIWMQFDPMLIKRAVNALDVIGKPASWIFIAMSAFFVMLLMFGVNPWTGIIPSLAYGLSTYFFLIIGAGHETKMIALAWAPLMVGAVYYTLSRNMWMGAALTALFASIEIGALHPQITYYFGMILLALWINQGIAAWKEKLMPRFAKATGLLALAGVLALGSTILPMWYTAEYSKYSIRGGTELTISPEGQKSEAVYNKGLGLDYATYWSYGKMESFNMFIPDFKGGSSLGGFSDDGPVAGSLTKYGARQLATQLPAYWGDQPMTGGPTYIGAVIIFLCVVGLFLLRGRCKWWVVIVSLIALMLAWGSNLMWFTELFYYWFPGYNKFRTVAMILVILEWSVPFIAALILSKLWRGGLTKQQVKKGVLRAFYVCGGFALLFALFGGSLFDFSNAYDSTLAGQGIPRDVIGAMHEERAGLLRSDAWRSFIFVALSAGVLLLWNRETLKRGWAIAILGVLVCADLIPVNMRYLSADQFVDRKKEEIVPTVADLEIMRDTTPGYRVFNATVSTFNDATTSYFHRSVGGYHGAKMQRYQDLIDFYLQDMDQQVLNMLNTKYLIMPDRETGAATVLENTGANGAAWFVDQVITVDSPDEEITELGGIDTKTQAVVDKRFAEMLPRTTRTTDSLAHITMTEYRSNLQKYDYYSQRDEIAVFSEIYYDKGWTMYIDGEQAPYFRADYVLRGAVLPAGSHTVEFRYRAENFDILSAVTLVCSILILLGVVAAGVAVVRCNKNRKENAGEPQTEA